MTWKGEKILNFQTEYLTDDKRQKETKLQVTFFKYCTKMIWDQIFWDINIRPDIETLLEMLTALYAKWVVG